MVVMVLMVIMVIMVIMFRPPTCILIWQLNAIYLFRLVGLSVDNVFASANVDIRTACLRDDAQAVFHNLTCTTSYSLINSLKAHCGVFQLGFEMARGCETSDCL